MYFDYDSVTCTLEHPFFVSSTWIEAKDLKKGDSLFAITGEKIIIDFLYKFKTDTATVVYNLEVSKNHNYFVSSTQILVHNQCKIEFTTVIKKLADGSAMKAELPIPSGYSQVKGTFSEGQKVFYNGKNYISPDVTSHIGGFWKMAKKV